MDVDIKTIEYDVELTTEDGTRYLLNGALIRLLWEEYAGELAQRATLTVANTQIGTASLMSLCKINCIISIYGRWNGGSRVPVFQGTIWEWQYESDARDELTIMAYDPLIRLQQSKEFNSHPMSAL